ncbi:hypothetical protein ILUMI_27276 [Ignelater luminosus]|uniref:ATP-dependent DNA helicase n=1 Tax=Ignelater luminosus TaxID=2038154 RepID=A0A8K0C4R4_IGNLU|nr:hypothetical protein ILUMI_27276 [Ignelater luminosus]
MHSAGEKSIRNRDVFTPAGYLSALKLARTKPKPYEAEYLEHTFFKDFSKLHYYTLIRPGYKVGDSSVIELSAIQYRPKVNQAKLLKEAKLIIWDEAAMLQKEAFECVDKLFKDLMKCNDKLFGSKVVVFGSDFRQILLVIRRGTERDIIDTSIKKSYIWPLLQKFELNTNVRLQGDPSQTHPNSQFSAYLLQLDERKVSERDNLIKLDPSICANLDNFEAYFSDMITNNDYDSIVQEDNAHQYPIEFLNSLTLSGIRPHGLVLKLHCRVILMRNLNSALGLCNGTQLQVVAFERNLIVADIIGDQHHSNTRVYIPRIDCTTLLTPIYRSPKKGDSFHFERHNMHIMR